VARRVLDEVQDRPIDGVLVPAHVRRPVHPNRYGIAVA
jgi:hypothetical protein